MARSREKPGNSGGSWSGDVIVVGAGMVGLALGRALAGAGLAVRVIDRDDPARWRAAEFDGRVSALALGSRRVLAGLGVWDKVAPAAAPVTHLRVTDNDAPAFVAFDRREADGEPLGHVIENRILRAALLDGTADWLMAPAAITAIDSGADSVRLSLDGGGALSAALVVGADGRNSLVRAEAAISVTEWRYTQAAIVATIVHDRPHDGTAEERFLPAGPFAVLPMVDDAAGRHRSSVVWTEPAPRAADLMALGAGDFDAELARRLGDHLGAAHGVGPRHIHPLGLTLAENYIAHRLALIGDAAHALHPIAGQGLNLGIRDVAALAEVIVDARRLGLDFGMKTVLEDFQRWRRFDTVTAGIATDTLNRLFSTSFAPLSWARRLGLAAFAGIAPLRRALARDAMGVSGDLPRLARGLPL